MKDIIAIIPAAGRGSRMMSLTEDMPKAMLPLHNKPIISWHLDKLIEEGIQEVCIIVGYKKEKLIDYVNKFYSNKINIIYAEQKELKGLAHAIEVGIDESYKFLDKRVLIILGDTIIKDSLNNYLQDFSWVGYNNVDDYKRWCLLETKKYNYIDSFIDKPEIDPETRKAVIGIYYFDSIKMLKECISDVIKKDIKIKGEYQLSSAMELYMNYKDIKAIEFKEWFDCGEVDSFNNTRKNITRYFNSIEVTKDNTIIKRSENETKIVQEINWFLNMPNKLRVHMPQLIDYSIAKGQTFYELEYINSTPMQELFMYNLPDLPQWEKFFNNVFTIIDKFKCSSNKSRFNCSEHLKEILLNKTQNRMSELVLEDYWKELMKKDEIKINDTTYKNIHEMYPLVEQYIKDNILNDCNKYWQIIHGDMFFGNMLYDTNNDSLKLIDPRGNFDMDGIYGDIRYDLAKLNHSIKGHYDFIVNGLYSFEENNLEFNYIFYDNPRHKVINEMFNKFIESRKIKLKDINIITGILFLSMIPLHKDNPNNQKMMYLTAIKIFNEQFN